MDDPTRGVERAPGLCSPKKWRVLIDQANDLYEQTAQELRQHGTTVHTLALRTLADDAYGKAVIMEGELYPISPYGGLRPEFEKDDLQGKHEA